MLNYIKSEIYQIVHRKAPWLFIIICSGLLIAMNVVLHQIGINDPKFQYNNTYFSFSSIYSNMYYLLFLCFVVSSIIFGDEHQSHTFKNSISFGISRSIIFISKILLQIVYALIAFVIILGCLIGSGYLLLENSGIIETEILLKSCMAGIPFFIWSLVLYSTLYVLLEKTGLATGIGAVIVLVIPLVMNEFAHKFDWARTIAKYLPLNLITDYEFKKTGFVASWLSSNGMLKYYGIGIIYTIIVFGIGLYFFRKKEIK